MLENVKIANSTKKNYKVSVYITNSNNNTTCEYFKTIIDASQYIIDNLSFEEQHELAALENLHNKEDMIVFFNKLIKAELTKKATKNREYNKNTTCTYKAKLINNTMNPTYDLNYVDKLILNNFKYCLEDNNIYVVCDNNYTLIGSIDNIKDNTISLEARRLLTEVVKRTLNTELSLQEYTREVLKNYTADFIEAQDIFKANIPDDNNTEELAKMEVDLPNGKKIEYSKISTTRTWEYFENILTYYCKLILDEALPSGIFSAGLAKLQPKFEADEKGKLSNFVGLELTQSSVNTSITYDNYFVSLFKYDAVSIRNNLDTIEQAPYVISDTDEDIAELYINNNNKPNIEEGLKQAHPRFDVFSQLFTSDELELMLAWCYSVLHPRSTDEHMNVLLKTSGGTGKTSYWMPMLNYWLSKLYGDKNLVLNLTGDDMCSSDKLMPMGRRTLAQSALTFIDECSNKSLAAIKSYTGSDRVRTTGIAKYLRATEQIITCKFLMCTNEDLKIEDSAGAYQRRLIVFKHFEKDNLHKNLPRELKAKNFAEEADYFYARCYLAWQNIVEKYGSLYEAKQACKNVSNNEASINNNEDFNIIYMNMLEDMSELKTEEGYYKVSATQLKEQFNDHREDADVSEKAYFPFIKWLQENHFKNNNISKKMRFGNKALKGWYLYDLKDEIVEDIEEILDDVPVDETLSTLDMLRNNAKIQSIVDANIII